MYDYFDNNDTYIIIQIMQEVFMTSYFDTVTVDRLIGKCYVMFVRDYLKFRPKVRI